MLKNVAGQKVGAQMVSATDGSAFTGSVTVYVTVDAGTQAAGSVGSGACTHEGNGFHTYAPAQAETNGDHVAFTFTGTGAVPATVQVYTLPATGVLAPTTAGRTLDVTATGAAGIDWGNVENPTTTLALTGTTVASTQKVDVETIKTQTVTCAAAVTVLASVGTAATSTAQTGDAYARLGAPAGASVSADVAAVKVDTAAILDDTGTSGVVVAAGSKTGYTLTATTGLGNQTADITGSLSGSVGSVTGAVGSVTGNVGGNVTGSVGSVATGGIAAASFAAGAVNAAALAADAAAEIADAVWDEAIAGHLTAGSTGEALNAAGAAGDPWTTALPGAYGAGSAGYIVGTNLNATVSSRSSHSAADVWAVATRVLTAGTNIALAKGVGVTGFNDLSAAQVNAEVDTALADYDAPTKAEVDAAFTEIKGATWSSVTDTLEAVRDRGDAAWTTATGFSTLSAADVRAAVGLASANLDTQLADLPTVAELTARTLAAADYATAANLATVAGYLDTEIASILEDTGTTIPAQIAALSFSTHTAADVWAVATRTLTSGGSGATAQEVWEYATRVLTASTNLSIPTAAAVADAVWDEALSGHAVAGSAGAALSAAGTAGDPWITALPGAYAAGTAGYIIGTYLDAALTSVAGDAAGEVVNLLGAATVTLSSPVVSGGDLLVVYAGDDYVTGERTVPSWSSSGWPDLTGGSAVFLAGDFSAACAFTDEGAATQTVTCDLAAADTSTLESGSYRVVATLASGSTVTLASGRLSVR